MGDNIGEIQGFMYPAAPHYLGGAAPGTPAIGIVTLEGVMTASVGDWIIRGVKNELYPCKPDIFEATYEQVTENQNETEVETNEHP